MTDHAPTPTIAPIRPRTAAPVAEAPKPSHPVPTTPPKGGWWWGTGRRKTATARVRIKLGSGKFLVNDKPAEEFFTEVEHRNLVASPLKVTNHAGTFDVFVNVQGGGYTGQAGAVALGLARAIKLYDLNAEGALRAHSLLTTDSRQVERKKYGQAGARRRFQFSKR